MQFEKALIVKSRSVLAIAANLPELAHYQTLSLGANNLDLQPGPMHDVVFDPSSILQYLKPGRHLEVRLLPPHAIAFGAHDLIFLLFV